MLPYDVCRCHGTDCDMKTSCARFTSLYNGGERTPYSDFMCKDGNMEYYIKVEDIK